MGTQCGWICGLCFHQGVIWGEGIRRESPLIIIRLVLWGWADTLILPYFPECEGLAAWVLETKSQETWKWNFPQHLESVWSLKFLFWCNILSPILANLLHTETPTTPDYTTQPKVTKLYNSTKGCKLVSKQTCLRRCSTTCTFPSLALWDFVPSITPLQDVEKSDVSAILVWYWVYYACKWVLCFIV